MNLLLLTEHDIVPETGQARLSDRRHDHLTRVLKAQPGQTIRTGLLGGQIGTARVVRIEPNATYVELEALDRDPPPPLPVQLVLALPRPKVLRRLLRAITALGIKRAWLINAAGVEKSYFSSPTLRPAKIHDELRLGLEQARDTILPEIFIVQRFRPFVEDHLPGLSQGTARWVADPQSLHPLPAAGPLPATLVIGPETGFDRFETEALRTIGFDLGHLGPRTLPAETATLAALGRFIPSS